MGEKLRKFGKFFNNKVYPAVTDLSIMFAKQTAGTNFNKTLEKQLTRLTHLKTPWSKNKEQGFNVGKVFFWVKNPPIQSEDNKDKKRLQHWWIFFMSEKSSVREAKISKKGGFSLAGCIFKKTEADVMKIVKQKTFLNLER